MKMTSWKQALKKSMEADITGDTKEFDADFPPCPVCGNTMVFHGHDDSGDFPYGEGYWKCPSCGKRITEDEL